jgi:hypothetical protein
MIVRIVLGTKRYEITGELKKLHSQEIQNLYSLISKMSRQIKSRRMR